MGLKMTRLSIDLANFFGKFSLFFASVHNGYLIDLGKWALKIPSTFKTETNICIATCALSNKSLSDCSW